MPQLLQCPGFQEVNSKREEYFNSTMPRTSMTGSQCSAVRDLCFSETGSVCKNGGKGHKVKLVRKKGFQPTLGASMAEGCIPTQNKFGWKWLNSLFENVNICSPKTKMKDHPLNLTLKYFYVLD